MGIFDILKKSNNKNRNLTNIYELNYENVEKIKVLYKKSIEINLY